MLRLNAGAFAVGFPGNEQNFMEGSLKQSKASVHLIDSDANVRRTLEGLLVSDTRQVMSHVSTDAFLAEFEPVHPACLILDLHLQDLASQKLLDHLRTTHADIPVIAIAAHTDLSAALSAIRCGAVDVCLKPLDPQTFLTLVDQTLAADAARERLRQQTAAARQRLARLTTRERQLFSLVVEGQSYKEMAATLGISPRTVEHHRAHIITKLGTDRVVDMVRIGLFAEGVITIPELTSLKSPTSTPHLSADKTRADDRATPTAAPMMSCRDCVVTAGLR